MKNRWIRKKNSRDKWNRQMHSFLSEEDKQKYYELCCNHTSIDRPVAKVFPRENDYDFMEEIEKRLRVSHVGNYRFDIAQNGPNYRG